MLWLVLLLVVVGLLLTIYGDTKNEPFCFYTGIGMGAIATLILLINIISL